LTNSNNNNNNNKPPVSWLDLRGSGLSVLERLLLEECLVRHDPENRSWLLSGTHETVRHRFLKTTTPAYIRAAQDPNYAAVVVMGIGGKPQKLLNRTAVTDDGVLTLKRFSGGGTVILDADSIWTTVIGRTDHFASVQAFPKPIMQWSADTVFGPVFQRLKAKQLLATAAAARTTAAPDTTVFLQVPNHVHRFQEEQQKRKQTMVLDTKSCGVENSGRTVQVVSVPDPAAHDDDDNDNNATTTTMAAPTVPDFFLRENDYVLGARKMGGNAQAIVKNGWLHHTSFLWNYDVANMEYLTLPDKRPDYRGDRPHDEFLVQLSQAYPALRKADFYQALQQVATEQFLVQKVTLREALAVVETQGGMQAWFERGGRTRILHEL
jgi:lipoate-protein ligase A